MKKRIIITSLIISLAALVAIMIVLIISNQSKNLSIYGMERNVKLELGNYKVKDYKYNKISGDVDCINFNVKSPNDFYDTIIKKNEFYSEDLDFKREDLYAYGFFYKNESFFEYEITENGNVNIKASFGSYYVEDDTTYFIPAPIHLNLSKNYIDNEKI